MTEGSLENIQDDCDVIIGVAAPATDGVIHPRHWGPRLAQRWTKTGRIVGLTVLYSCQRVTRGCKTVISASPESQVEVGPRNVGGQPGAAICGEYNERDMLLQTKHKPNWRQAADSEARVNKFSQCGRHSKWHLFYTSMILDCNFLPPKVCDF